MLKRLYKKRISGIGIVEIILILVILIAIVFLFKTEIKKVVDKSFQKISTNSDDIIDE